MKLFEIKKEIPSIKKNAENPFFKSSYASLDNILEVIEPILAKYECVIVSEMQGRALVTRIIDTKDGSNLLKSEFELPAINEIQKIGSAITYARRYNLVAMLNLNIEEDDDGNATKPTTTKLPEATKLSDRAIDLEHDIKYSTDIEVLKAVGAVIKKEKLTQSEKEYLRSIYKIKEDKLK